LKPDVANCDQWDEPLSTLCLEMAISSGNARAAGGRSAVISHRGLYVMNSCQSCPPAYRLALFLLTASPPIPQPPAPPPTPHPPVWCGGGVFGVFPPNSCKIAVSPDRYQLSCPLPYNFLQQPLHTWCRWPALLVQGSVTGSPHQQQCPSRDESGEGGSAYAIQFKSDISLSRAWKC
jgi:hypothetical protein